MSSNTLNKRERQILEGGDGSADDQGKDRGDETVTIERSLLDDLLSGLQRAHDRIDQLEENQSTFATNTAEKLNQIEQHLDGEVSTAGATVLDKKASMPRELRRESLSASEFRATVIHNHWDDLSWTAGDENNRKYLVDTQKVAPTRHMPSIFKRDLERELGDDLGWNEVYRAMKMVAKQSAPDSDDVEIEKDQAGRTHIKGGEYEYHEKPTPDADDVKKVLVEVP